MTRYCTGEHTTSQKGGGGGGVWMGWGGRMTHFSLLIPWLRTVGSWWLGRTQTVKNIHSEGTKYYESKQLF
jgi:hypothetical protein